LFIGLQYWLSTDIKCFIILGLLTRREVFMKLKIAAVILTALFLTGCSGTTIMENVESGVAAVPSAIGSAVSSTVDFVTGIF